jgi:hypothetical protein
MKKVTKLFAMLLLIGGLFTIGSNYPAEGLIASYIIIITYIILVAIKSIRIFKN